MSMEDQELDAYEYYLQSKVNLLQRHLESLPNASYPCESDKDKASILLMSAETSHMAFRDWRLGKLMSIDIRHLTEVQGRPVSDAVALTNARVDARLARVRNKAEQEVE